MTILEQEDRKYEENQQWYHPSTKFHFTIEEVFETLDTADVEMSAAHFMIEPIVNRNICNTFINIIDQTNPNNYIKLQVNSLNPYNFR